MPIEKVTLYEERCDRCRALLATKMGEGETAKVVACRASSMGSFKVEMAGDAALSYDNICPACHGRLMTLIAGMGPIDRTRGGKTAKKSGKKEWKDVRYHF